LQNRSPAPDGAVEVRRLRPTADRPVQGSGGRRAEAAGLTAPPCPASAGVSPRSTWRKRRKEGHALQRAEALHGGIIAIAYVSGSAADPRSDQASGFAAGRSTQTGSLVSACVLAPCANRTGRLRQAISAGIGPTPIDSGPAAKNSWPGEHRLAFSGSHTRPGFFQLSSA